MDEEAVRVQEIYLPTTALFCRRGSKTVISGQGVKVENFVLGGADLITIICGSPSGKSRTLNYAEETAKMTGASYRVYTASDWHIVPCRGCHQCFEKGRCVQNEKDDFPELLSDLRQSDGIIFASPVYAGTVTGQMKILIDRMSVLLHEMPLIGIPAVVLTTSSGNHLEETLGYLKQVMEWMGASVVAETAIRSGLDASGTCRRYLQAAGPDASGMCRRYQPEVGPETGEKDQEPFQALSLAAGALRLAMDNPDCLPVPDRLEAHFRHQNRRYKSQIPALEYFPNLFGEAAVWKAQGYDRCETIRDVIAMRAGKHEDLPGRPTR